MRPKRAFCLFEQSGTFKNEFIKLGIPAEDYDIQNEYNQTDHVVDLFAEIEGGVQGKSSIFDDMTSDDIIFAFFPCTRFECQISLLFRGEAVQCKKWSDKKKLEYSIGLHKELHRNYVLLSWLTMIAIDKGLNLIIENPYTQPHYLTGYWCIRPKIIDQDRTDRGDYMKKPTQFFFIGFEPENNIIMEPIEYVELRKHLKMTQKDGKSRETRRSEIHPQYANRFIREHILDRDLWDK